MAVRPIDANAMLNELRPVSFESEHSAMLLSDVSKMMREWVERQPTLTPPNEPLTIEQLREMDGQPVWIQNIEEPNKSQWRLCHWDRGKYLVLQGISVKGYLLEEYGESWLAYAYPPAHIDWEEWVSVEERLPEDEKDGETVLVIVFGKPHENITLHGAIMTAGYFRDEGWVLNEYPEWEGPEVTHWMPLPNPPAELEKRLRGVRA